MDIKRQEALRKFIDLIADPKLQKLCASLPLKFDFMTAPAACRRHQAYEGGLVDHTLEVLEIALATASALPLKGLINRDVLIVAALWHDFGKIWDYEPNEAKHPPTGMVPDLKAPDFVYTRHRWTIRHLVRSYHCFCTRAEEVGLDKDLTEEIAHAILGHHGRAEWGSPVEPLTPEAMILHQADMLSAAFTDGYKHIFREPRQDWSKVSI